MSEANFEELTFGGAISPENTSKTYFRRNATFSLLNTYQFSHNFALDNLLEYNLQPEQDDVTAVLLSFDLPKTSLAGRINYLFTFFDQFNRPYLTRLNITYVNNNSYIFKINDTVDSTIEIELDEENRFFISKSNRFETVNNLTTSVTINLFVDTYAKDLQQLELSAKVVRENVNQTYSPSTLNFNLSTYSSYFADGPRSNLRYFL